MTLAAPQKGNPATPIRARVAAKLYARPMGGLPAGSIPRSRFTKRGAAEISSPITVGQALRAGLVLAVGLMLAPTPHIDVGPLAQSSPVIGRPK